MFLIYMNESVVLAKNVKKIWQNGLNWHKTVYGDEMKCYLKKHVILSFYRHTSLDSLLDS